MNNNTKIKGIDWLLIFGLILAPMDSLRIIPKIGIAEIILFLWILFRLRDLKINKNIFLIFWVAFLIVTSLGICIGICVAPEESMAFPDFFIYVFFALISVTTTTYLPKNSKEYINEILRKCGSISTIWYFLIFIIAKYTNKSFLGINFWFSTKFTGGAENPNKLAVFICEILFLNVYNLFNEKLFKNKIKFIINIIICYFIGVQTQSSMFYVAVIISMCICSYVMVFTKIKSKRIKMIVVLLTILFVGILSLAFYDNIYTMLYNWISMDSNRIKTL